jgi:hypothetical protein
MPKPIKRESSPLSVALPASSQPSPSRYPKRKRKLIDYHISGDEAEEDEDIELRVRLTLICADLD